MKIIIAPDKYKGSLTSLQVCNAIQKGITAYDKDIDTAIFPMADGGDGFAAVLKYYLHSDTVFAESEDALGRKISASYEWDKKNKTAIIELATCSGIALLKKEERNPMITSTIGTGILICHAIKKGAKKILLGIGGSAT
ncbi:MAG: glycerate kinase, partial [Ginsengibacter sp.]